ncbi:hypothetical protein [Mucilaginibacter xinganensis]|uniref:Uncharacterized protein n=1 Tax=Mucilaginibacter xinganensis TaxID=1234841 RepID=A0A223NX27_9SPHI|nr:hypothetical protein [Mucilaginibacter xinganensis]ASU34111.1 hypothetical protein MuYL_2221 [Mucilaginibacter xinganensis]
MFQVTKGAINVYSYLSESDKTAFNPGTIVAVQLNDGPIMKLNEDNLKLILAANSNALKFVKRKDYLKATTKYNEDMDMAVKK